MVDNKPSESRAIADALCGAIYTRTFEYLVQQCSLKSFPDHSAYERATGGDAAALHLVDMPGWERFDNGTGYVQQLLVNFSEEKFHALFLESVFVREIDRYAAEGVELGAVPYLNATPYLELFDSATSGLIHFLEDACQSLRVDDKAFLDKILLHSSKSELKLVKAGGPKAKATVFIVKHTFADVSYDCEGFVLANKNNALPASAMAVLATSKIAFIAGDVEAAAAGTPAPPGPPPPAASGVAGDRSSLKARGENKAVLIANYFMTRNNNALSALIASLKASSNTYHVLCVGTTANKFEENPVGLGQPGRLIFGDLGWSVG